MLSSSCTRRHMQNSSAGTLPRLGAMSTAVGADPKKSCLLRGRWPSSEGVLLCISRAPRTQRNGRQLVEGGAVHTYAQLVGTYSAEKGEFCVKKNAPATCRDVSMAHATAPPVLAASVWRRLRIRKGAHSGVGFCGRARHRPASPGRWVAL